MASRLKVLHEEGLYPIWYKLQLMCLILAAVTLPFLITWNNVALGLLVLTWLLSGGYKAKVKAAFQNKLFLLFVGVFALQLVGMLYTNDLSEGWGKIERKSALFVLPFVLAGSHKLKEKHVLYVVSAFILSCTVLAAYVLFILFITYGGVNNIPALTETIDKIMDIHHAYSGMYMVFAAATSFYLSFYYKHRFERKYSALYFVISLFLYIFLIILAARTAVIISFLLVGFVLFTNLKIGRQKKVLGVTLLVGVMLAVAILALPNTKSKIVEFYELRGVHSPLTPRLIKWKCCISILSEQHVWLLGVGTGDAQQHLQQCYSKEKFWGELYELNAHNEYLEEMVRHGIIGLLVFLVSLLCPLLYYFKRKKRLYIIFLFVFMISSFTESTLSRQKGVVFYALFNSMFAFSYLGETRAAEREYIK